MGAVWDDVARGHEGALAVEIAARSVDCRAWVSVYPIRLGSSDPRPAVRAAFLERDQSFLDGLGLAWPPPGVILYHAVRFELPLEILAQEETLGNDYDLYMRDAEERYLYGDEALVACLRDWGVELSQLRRPWQLDYPL
jgi:hypothetical protein